MPRQTPLKPSLLFDNPMKSTLPLYYPQQP